MTQIEKAHAWFKSNGYSTTIDDHVLNATVCLTIQVWNDTLEDSIDVYLDQEEIEFRAKLWDEQQNSNQTKLC
jgi:hypothetical protein